MTLSQTLVVPVDVRAFCVGPSDVDRVTGFAGASLDFSQLGQASDAVGAAIISRDNGVLRPMDEAPLSPLTAGVHLHWNLPRALTHGQMTQSGDDPGHIAFPAVPNRWLVTRIAATDNPFQYARSWVVESDHIATTPPDPASITIFVGYDQDLPYRYLGRAVPADGWSEPEPGTSALKQLTEQDLTAVQTGDPLFASFYPSCRNVFGFHDDLSDVGDALDGVPILYVVAGWYSNAGNDPLQSGLDAATLAGQLKWGVPDGTPGSFNRSLYTGVIQAIGWSRSGSQVPEKQPQLAADVALGGNGPEAMAALIGREVDDPTHRDILENLLSAFQMGIASNLHEPHPDRLAEMMDRLQAAGFGHVESGVQWTVVDGDDPDKAVALGDLPPDLAGLLTALNDVQARRDAAAREVDAARRQLYLDWYRYGLTKLVVDDGSDDSADERLDNIADYVTTGGDLLFDTTDTANKGGQLLNDLATLEQELSQKQSAVTAAAADHGWAPKALVAPWYYRPNDPVVVLSGVDTEHRLHGDDAEDLVPCRPATALISSLSVNGRSIDRPATSRNVSPPAGTPIPAALWDEAALLDAAWLARAAGSADVAQALKDFLASGNDNATITGHEGTPPVADAVQWWDGGNPWLPLFMQWTGDYRAIPGYDGAMQSLPPTYVNGQFTLDDEGNLSPRDLPGSAPVWTFTGQAILTPFAAKSLISALNNAAGDDDLASDIQKAKDYLDQTPLLYQGLSGFHDRLLMLEQIPQLAAKPTDGDQIIAVHDDDGLFHTVENYVGGAQRLASFPNGDFVPLRAGYLGVSLRVADVFGQIRDVTPVSFSCASAMRTGTSESNQQAYLPPRFAQPARLTARFLSAADDSVEASILSSPLCGWFLPNHLENSLMVYDADGTARGALELPSTGVRWMSAPGETYGDNLDQAMAGANQHQIDLVHELHDGGADRLHAVMQAIDNAARSSTGDLRPDPALAILIGSPIALVQMVVELDLFGPPAVNQSWDAFADEMEKIPSNPAADDFISGRTSNGLAQVGIDVLIGAQGRLRDGVLGYFVANQSGLYDFSQFHGPGAPITLKPDGKRVQLLLLVDPRARIHAISGILPTAALTIPPDLTLPFLDKLSVTFPARPVLATNAGFDLPLPPEAGYGWSWLQHDGTQWKSMPLNQKPSPDAEHFVPQRIYSGWLRLTRQSQQT